MFDIKVSRCDEYNFPSYVQLPDTPRVLHVSNHWQPLPTINWGNITHDTPHSKVSEDHRKKLNLTYISQFYQENPSIAMAWKHNSYCSQVQVNCHTFLPTILDRKELLFCKQPMTVLESAHPGFWNSPWLLLLIKNWLRYWQ